MTMCVAINGFGRIGRSVFRILSDHPDIDVVCINGISKMPRWPTSPKYGTVMVTFQMSVTFDDKALYRDHSSF